MQCLVAIPTQNHHIGYRIFPRVVTPCVFFVVYLQILIVAAYFASIPFLF